MPAHCTVQTCKCRYSHEGMGGVPICEEQWARHSWRFDEHASSDVAFNGVTTIHKLHKGEVNVERKVCLGVKLQQSTVATEYQNIVKNIFF